MANFNKIQQLKIENIRDAFILIALLFICLFSTSMAYAESLTATPLDGGNTIRFGRIDSPIIFDKEVRIRVSGFEGSQYQVYQRIVHPLTNERAERLNRSAFITKSLDASNATGTLYLNSYERLRDHDQLIYISDTAGNGDSFRMLYSINRSALNYSGIFNAQVLYVVRSVGASQQKEVVLSVHMEIAEEFSVSSKASSGKNLIKLDSEQNQEGYVHIAYTGFMGSSIKITQEWIEQSINADGNELDFKAVEFYVTDTMQGQSDYEIPTPLNRSQIEIYKSNVSNNEMMVYFKLNKDIVAEQKSGIYRGKLRYSMDSDRGLEKHFFDINFEINISSIFKLEIEYPKEVMSFSQILPSMPPQERAVIVRIKTNLARPYVVTQNINMALQNERGEAIEKDYFLIKEENVGNSYGTLKYMDYMSVSVNDSTLYVSDQQGSPAEFRVIYQLKPYKSMKDGNYQTSIIYSLSEQ